VDDNREVYVSGEGLEILNDGTVRAEAVVRCHNVDTHPDMAPEFSDGPIVIACRKPAVALFVWDYEDLEGPTSDVLCVEHTIERTMWSFEGGRRFEARTLSANDIADYLAGVAHARSTDVTDGQFLVAANTPMWGEAGLWPPENSPELFDIGWAWTMTERVQAWAREEEEAL